MSSTNYSYFNPNNYNSPIRIPDFNTFDFSKLPLYSVNGTQLITYILIGVTTVTLGYITLTEKEGSESEPASDPEPEPEPKPEPEPEPEPTKEGGKKRKTNSKKRKQKKTRKTTSRKK